MNGSNLPSVRMYIVVWAVLLALLALTFGSAYVPLGRANAAINIVIAIVKAGLVAAFFMHLRTGRVMNRLAGAAALLVLMILLALTLTDYLTRG